jgi:apolipoprotein N-acyltransferase
VERLHRARQLSATMHFGTSDRLTFYTRHGDWFAWGCLIAGLALCARR